MDLQLNGQAALVTGASRGLGGAIVKALAAEGGTVFTTTRNTDLLTSLKMEVETPAA